MLERTKEANVKHGMGGTRTYGCWQAMMSRCYNPNVKSFGRYGGAGIRVFKSWHQFENFLRDMGKAPSETHTIGRKDHKKDYGPRNCEWQTWKQQARNRSSNKILLYRGQKKAASEWAEVLGISLNAIYRRLKKGWDVEDVFTIPVDQRYNRYK